MGTRSAEAPGGVLCAASGATNVDNYHALNFYADDTFTITDPLEVIIEQNNMTEVTESTFVGNINVQTEYSDLVGHSTYAEYEITYRRGTVYLKIAFYDDEAKADKYITFYCEKAV
jgi:hypothetical protein